MAIFSIKAVLKEEKKTFEGNIILPLINLSQYSTAKTEFSPLFPKNFS
jgi:hypothetical protein